MQWWRPGSGLCSPTAPTYWKASLAKLQDNYVSSNTDASLTEKLTTTLDLGCFHTWIVLLYWIICSGQFAYFPWGGFVFTVHYCKAEANTLAGYPLCGTPSKWWLPFTLLTLCRAAIQKGTRPYRPFLLPPVAREHISRWFAPAAGLVCVLMANQPLQS